MAVTTVGEPMLSRLDRLDIIVRRLEELRSAGGNRTPKSSCPSTPSSGTLTSDGHVSSSIEFSPRSMEKHCRPIDDVIVETGVKGNLIERLLHVEDRVAKLEEEIDAAAAAAAEKRRVEEQDKMKKKKKKAGLKQLVKSCATGNN